MRFELLSEITHIETIAVGSRIRNLNYLRKQYGAGRWRKCKGIALVRFEDGYSCLAEVHWYEAHGIGKRDMKVKTPLEE